MDQYAWDVFFDILKQIEAHQADDKDKARIVQEQAEKHGATTALISFCDIVDQTK